MYRKYNTTIIILMFVLLCSIVTAPKPGISSLTLDNTLIIEYPLNDYFIYNSTFSLHYHVFNSNGSALNTSHTNCTIHIYNLSNNHVVNSPLLNDSNGIDKYVTLNLSNLSHKGVYSFIVYCNSTLQAGFLSGSFELTPDGKAPGELNPFYIIVVLLPILIGLLFAIGAFTMGDKHTVYKIFAYLLSVSSFFIAAWFTSAIITEFVYFPYLVDSIVISVFIYGFILLVVLVYFITYLIRQIVHTIAQKKNEKLEY